MLPLFICDSFSTLCYYFVETSRGQVETRHSTTEFRDSNTYYVALDSIASLLDTLLLPFIPHYWYHLINTRVFNDSLTTKITKSSKILKLFGLIFLWSSISLLRLSVPYLIGFFYKMWSWLSFHFYIFAFIWHTCSNFWFLFVQVTPWLQRWYRMYRRYDD